MSTETGEVGWKHESESECCLCPKYLLVKYCSPQVLSSTRKRDAICAVSVLPTKTLSSLCTLRLTHAGESRALLNGNLAQQCRTHQLVRQ